MHSHKKNIHYIALDDQSKTKICSESINKVT